MTRGRIRRQYRKDAGPTRPGDKVAPGRSAPDDRTRLRVGHPEDLLAVVPYLLGYHPSEAIVAVLIRNRRVHVSMRIDLPDTDAYAAVGAELTDYIEAIAAREKAGGVVLLGYSAHREVVEAVLSAMINHVSSVELLDVYRVDSSRWWSLTCNRPCCPPEGVPYDLTSNTMAAEAVFAGLTAEPSRDDLERWVRGPDPAEVPRLEAEAHRLGSADPPPDRMSTVSEILTSVAASVSASGDPDPDEATSLRWAMGLRDLITRDMVWASMTRENAPRHAWLWHRVVAQVPPRLSAAPLGLMALASWIAGNGSLLNIAGDRLRAVHPDYSLGGLLLSMSDNGVPPSAWAELAAELRAGFDLTDYLEEATG